MQSVNRPIRQWVWISCLFVAFVVSSAVPGAFTFGKSKIDADFLASPSGPVHLVVDGAIKGGNAQGIARLDMEILQTLPAHRLRTTTSVTDGVRQFDGFLMRDVLSLVKAQGKSVQAQALNNYSVEIPISDFYDYDVLLATHMDGARLQVSDKGPFWIVYPRDDWHRLQDIRFDYRWVWQLTHLTVK